MSQQSVTASADQEEAQSLPRIIFASAAGTMIEWYDFYIFGSLATVSPVSSTRPVLTLAILLPGWQLLRLVLLYARLARLYLDVLVILLGGNIPFLLP